MEGVLNALYQGLIDWGYMGLFVSALLAGSIVPFGSEVILGALIAMGLHPWGCLVAATVGNTLGGMTCYYMGRLGKREWVERFFKIDPDRMARINRQIERRGAWVASLAFLPGVGETIAVGLGLMRINALGTSLFMLLGKLIRYLIIVAGMLSIS